MIGKAIALYALWRAWQERKNQWRVVAVDSVSQHVLLEAPPDATISDYSKRGTAQAELRPRIVEFATGQHGGYVLRDDGSVISW